MNLYTEIDHPGYYYIVLDEKVFFHYHAGWKRSTGWYEKLPSVPIKGLF